MELIFNLDDAWVGFKQESAPAVHYVRLVMGNDTDVVSDWNYKQGDPDGFSATMEKFDAEEFA